MIRVTFSIIGGRPSFVTGRPTSWVLALAALALTSTLHAQSLTWDANGTLPVNGNDTVTPANNVWDTTNLRWHNGTTYQLWNNAALSDAVFGGTAGTVTLGTAITAHNLTFNSNNYLLTGNTLTLGGLTPTITVTPTTATINSVIAGTAGLTKAGSGTLVLGAANTYTGVTLLQAGTLSATNNAALGAAANVASNFVINGGAAFNFNTATIARNFTLTGGVVRMSGGGTGVFSGSPTLTASTELQLISSGTFSGDLADTGANVLRLSKTVSGTVILSGNNTYSGPTLLSAGIVRLNSVGALSANSNLAISGGGILELGAADFTRSLGSNATQVQWTGSGGFAAFGANRIVNLGGTGATLSWGSTPGFIGNGQTLILASGSANATVDFQNALDLNGAARTIQINNGSAATDVLLSAPISNGGLIYSGTGVVQLTAANTYTGTTTLAGASVRVSVIGNGGSAGGLGAASSAASNLVFDNNSSILTYAGIGESTDRGFSFGAATQAQIAASGTGALVWNGAPTVASGTRTLVLRGTSTATNTFTGLLANGGGTLALTKNDAGTWRLSGTNTYTGTTSILGAVLEVDSLADGAVASSIGASGNAAANLLVNNSTLRYVGNTAASTDRNFTGTATPRIESSGTGALTWNGTMLTTAAANLTLGGTNIGNNLFAGVLADLNTAGAIRTGLIKAGTGNWALSGSNTYTADTRIDAGILRLDGAGTLSGGLTSDGVTQGSLLVFNGGQLALTAASGDFNRTLATTQFVNTVRWQSGGGFAAFGGDRAVNLGGAGAKLTWNTGGFVPNGQALILSHASSDSTLEFRNSIDFSTANRTVLVNDGSAAVDAVLSGVLSSTTTGGGLVKTGTGTLVLSADNTYTGTTTISGGLMQLGTGGTTGSLGTGNVTNNAQLAINRNNAYTISQVVSGSGSVRQNGAGTTTLAANNTYSGGTVINAGTLQVGNGGTTGAFGTGAVTNNATLAINRNNALTVAVVIGGTGSLQHNGVGTTTLTGINTFTGAIELNAGVLAVSNIQNGGVSSNLGAASSAAGNLVFDGGTLRFTGTARSSDRNFIIEDGGATFDASGTGALTWSGAPTYDVSDQARNLTLTGTTTGNAFSGVLSDNVSGALALTKNGTGSWVLLGSNSYSGATTINAGILQIGNGGSSGTLGTGAVVNNATLTFNRSDALSVVNAISSAGTLNQSGAGTTLLSGLVNAGATNINLGALSVSGTLVTPMLALGNASTLNVLGTVQASGATPTVIAGSSGVNSVIVASGATLRANGDLGSGSDLLDVAGTLLTGAGILRLGANDDTFTIHDGTSILGTVDGGSGTNTFNTAIDVAADLGAVTGFQTLLKTGTGVLNINGPGVSNFTTVTASAGTLNVAATGSVSGALNTTVASGATLNVDGSYVGSSAANTLSISGTVTGTGTIDLASGNDVLTLNDGAVLTTTINGGGHTISDAIVLNNAADLAFDGSRAVNFEVLTKQNTGIATLSGLHSYATSASIDAGTLDVSGTLVTPILALGDASTLNVLGTVQASGATPTVVTGSAGVNSVMVANGATLQASGDLGASSDLLDVAGTLDTGAGVLSLGDDDDTFTIHDGTSILGTVDGGSGINTINTVIDVAADLGAVTGFQTLLKTGTGTLNINGPGVSNFTTVTTSAGTLNVAAAGAVNGVTSTSVSSGATLNVLGSYVASAGSDTFSVAGTVIGSGAIDLGAGDDTLTLDDGAAISATIDAGTHASGDLIVLNNAGAFTFDAVSTTGFEILTKQNTGIATLTGVQVYSAGTHVNAGSLAVSGSLQTPSVDLADGSTLSVLGTLEAAGSTPTAIAGSAGVNTVTVGAGAALRANGDLAAGADLLDVAGTLDTGAGILSLGADDDTFTIHDGTSVIGTVDGGSGINIFDAAIDVSADLSAVTGFQTLLKTAAGMLNINGPGTSIFDTVLIQGGTVRIGAAATLDSQTTVVAAGTTLRVDGNYLGTGGNDAMTVSGTVAGAGIIDLGSGDDVLTLDDGAVMNATINGGGHAAGDTLIINNAGGFAFDGTRTINFEVLTKQNTGIVTLAGAQAFLGAINIDAGTLQTNATLSSNLVTVGTAGTLSSSGTVVGNVTNSGVLDTGAATFGTLTIRGNYVGAGGRLDLRVALADDSSPTDVLSIDGGSASGTTRVRVINENGLGARTIGSGIQVVRAINGATTTADAFLLDGPVRAGAYSYDLFRGTEASVDPQSWYLRSRLQMRDVASLSTALIPLSQAYGLAVIGTLHERDGAELGTACTSNESSGCRWARAFYRTGERDGGGTESNGSDFDYDITGIQLGTDVYQDADEHSSDRVGLYLSMGPTDGDVKRDDGTTAGDAELSGFSVGAYWTHRRPNLWYVDSTLLGTYFSQIKLTPADDDNAQSYGWNVAASVEGGATVALAAGWALQPQGQVIVQYLEQDNIHTTGTTISFDDTSTVVGRLGIELSTLRSRSTVGAPSLGAWLRANYWSELSGDAETTLTTPAAAPTTLHTDFDDSWVELAAGVAAKLNASTSVYASVSASQSTDDSDTRAVQGNIGIKVEW